MKTTASQVHNQCQPTHRDAPIHGYSLAHCHLGWFDIAGWKCKDWAGGKIHYISVTHYHCTTTNLPIQAFSAYMAEVCQRN
uniref:Uncharacterized protein n=1 Tax=Arundo donax TaxID=35708 RepID=A0A0A9UB35_ARUDO